MNLKLDKTFQVYLFSLLTLILLTACQSVPKAEELYTEPASAIDWSQEAHQATSYDSFILAMISMMDTDLSDEIETFYQFIDSKGELITRQRWQKARMNLLCPAPSHNWIYLANYEVAEGFRVNFRVEDNSDLYWCSLVVSQINEQFFITNIIDYRSNLSVVSALESYESLPSIEIRTTKRAKKVWGVRELLTEDISVSKLDQLIDQLNLDSNNMLLRATRARLLTRPVSDESMEAYVSIIGSLENLDSWPLQRFYQQLGMGASDDELIQYAENFTRITSDPVWPYLFWSRVANASDDFDMSERLLQIALFNDPLNDLPYFALMRTYAQQSEFGHLLQVRSLLESKFDYRIEPEYFFDQEVYGDFVVSENFRSWAKQR